MLETALGRRREARERLAGGGFRPEEWRLISVTIGAFVPSLQAHPQMAQPTYLRSTKLIETSLQPALSPWYRRERCARTAQAFRSRSTRPQRCWS